DSAPLLSSYTDAQLRAKLLMNRVATPRHSGISTPSQRADQSPTLTVAIGVMVIGVGVGFEMAAALSEAAADGRAAVGLGGVGGRAAAEVGLLRLDFEAGDAERVARLEPVGPAHPQGLLLASQPIPGVVELGEFPDLGQRLIERFRRAMENARCHSVPGV